MPKKKPAKLDSSVSKAPADAGPKKHYNVTMDGDEDEIDGEMTLEEANTILGKVPKAVRDEMNKELDAQMSEMIQKFEEHAKEYEKEHPETAPKHGEEIGKRTGDKSQPLPEAPKAKTPKAKRGKRCK